MVKKILFAVGVILVLTSIFSLSEVIFNFSLLSEFGKGYLAGKTILLVIGIILILLSRKKATFRKSAEEI